MPEKCTFEADERARQSAYFRANFPEHIGFKGADYRLAGSKWLNVAPAYSALAEELFERCEPKIESHTHANHALSSQMCCVNFLLPLADQPAMLSRWIDHIMGIEGAKAVPVEERGGREWYVAFEWFPATDYLNEANAKGQRPRGAQSTSVDAAVRFTHRGVRQVMLIEWKYTESYGAVRSDGERRGDAKRLSRYSNIWQRPHGPMRADLHLQLEQFFLNPWYQLLRQQMLAYHYETDPLSDTDRVTLVHISPSRNRALHRVHGDFAAFGDDAFDVFEGLLQPEFADRFRAVTTEVAFSPLLAWSAPWARWLQDRYPSLWLGG